MNSEHVERVALMLPPQWCANKSLNMRVKIVQAVLNDAINMGLVMEVSDEKS